MSCGCSGGDSYNDYCNSDTPYPQVSPESIPSLISNLIHALYGEIQKDASSGVVRWVVPCDPSNTAELPNIPRNEAEGLLCYLLRVASAVYTPAVQAIRTANLTLALTDANTIIRMSSASPMTLTIPSNSTVEFSIGTQIMVQQVGVGQISVAGATTPQSVSLQAAGGKVKSVATYSVFCLIKVDSNTWAITGDLTI